ncbi:MAG: hypothetical protein GEV03_16285 [Streptosporangiales bacterium]|nr:hypothetical protein [Streptosporangiales bacterium]
MLDACEMEQRGKPTITICHDKFEGAARLHAKLQDMPALPLLIEPNPEGGSVSHDTSRLAQEKLPDVLAALVSDPQANSANRGE